MGRDLRRLPKAHLHVHLEGAMRRSTLTELCRRDGVPEPTVRGAYTTFADFQELYVTARSAVRSVDDLSRLVREVVEDAAADGAVWIEPAINLAEHAHLGDHTFVLDTVVAAGRQASADTGVGVGWLVTADRTKEVTAAVEQAASAARGAGRGVVAFGLANDESARPPEVFAPAFAVARNAGVICAPHAGEHAGAESVRAAVTELGAQRIQHGVRAVEDPAVLRLLVEERVCLDVCPTSNVALGVATAVEAHPLPALLEAGVACSINADDPLLFGVGLLDEYTVSRQRLGLDDETLARCARTSIERSGAPAALRRRAVQDVHAWLAT